MWARDAGNQSDRALKKLSGNAFRQDASARAQQHPSDENPPATLEEAHVTDKGEHAHPLIPPEHVTKRAFD
jgi:hypothetical protein